MAEKSSEVLRAEGNALYKNGELLKGDDPGPPCGTVVMKLLVLEEVDIGLGCRQSQSGFIWPARDHRIQLLF
jgi:hypothetical protein